PEKPLSTASATSRLLTKYNPSQVHRAYVLESAYGGRPTSMASRPSPFCRSGELSLRGMVTREGSTTIERSSALHGARDMSIRVHCRTGSVAPRICTGEFKQEILPRAGPAGLISPPVLGELSRLSTSEFEVHRV